MKTTNEQTYKLAGEFTRILKSWAKPGEWETMVKDNAAEKDDGICHSHDFCDANMAMAEAFQKVHGRECVANDDGDIAKMTEAWDLAKSMWQDITARDSEYATAQAAISILKGCGIDAGWELQPGYIDVRLPRGGHSLACGTLNGPWATQHCVDDGTYLDDCLDLELPRTTGPVELAVMLTREYIHQVSRMGAQAKTVADLAKQYGWGTTHTGGNCTALEWAGQHFYAYITDEAEVPERPDTPCYLSLYLKDQDHSEPQVAWNCTDTESAMKIIAQLADNPMESIIARKGGVS
jgi:hypothetical protein